jgi:hypothetical protein
VNVLEAGCLRSGATGFDICALLGRQPEIDDGDEAFFLQGRHR